MKMGIMEVDKSKCLICEVPCPQKGLAFFKFPKEELRLKMWIKEISPLLDILKVQPKSLKENGKICARHFRKKDFINSKQNSLVHNACPSLSVSNLNLSLNIQKNSQANKETFREKFFFENEQSSDGSEADVFQCGRCKTQFEILSEFIDHKRFRCQSMGQKLTKINENTNSSLQDYLLPLESSLNYSFEDQLGKSLNQSTKNSFPEQPVKIISQESSPDNRIVSLVFNDNGSPVGNSGDVSAFSTPIIISPQSPLCYNKMVIGTPTSLSLSGHVTLTPQTPINCSILLNNKESEGQVSSVILTTSDINNSNKMIYPCLIQNNSELAAPSKTFTNQNGLKNEVISPTESVEDSNESLVYYKLTNVIPSQQTSLGNILEKKTGVEASNQIQNSESEKPKTKLPCSYCGKDFEKPFNLQQHERIHTGERPFQCIVCGRAFSQKSNVRKHMTRHRVWPKGKQTLGLRNQYKEDSNRAPFNEIDYFCQYCTLSFKSYAEHKKHLATHSNVKVYRCVQKYCYETFSDLDEFLSHSKMHSSAEFQCHICLKAFISLEDLGVHQYDHDKTGKEKRKETEIKLKCQVCRARFKTSESLKNHLAVDTHNYECVHCKSVFCSERFLRRHLFIHTDSSQSKFKCQNCKKAFRTQQNLKNHLFIHLKEKPFTCDHCNKQFASKYRLKRHVAIHLNQFLDCPFKKHLGCDKTFYRKDKLKDHVNTHSHCKERSCRICSKIYCTVQKVHQYTKGDQKTVKAEREIFRCLGCSQTFRKQKQLSQHHCTVEERKPDSLEKSSEVVKEKILETVSNIEIIMVPFGASGKKNCSKMNSL